MLIMVASLFFQPLSYSQINKLGYKNTSFLNDPKADDKFCTKLPCFPDHIPPLDTANMGSGGVLGAFWDRLQSKLYILGFS
tara:strand:+ start:1102 stop:1344 length:243 start_codon:yes stop_codon:yes gene_type:complete